MSREVVVAAAAASAVLHGFYSLDSTATTTTTATTRMTALVKCAPAINPIARQLGAICTAIWKRWPRANLSQHWPLGTALQRSELNAQFQSTAQHYPLTLSSAPWLAPPVTSGDSRCGGDGGVGGVEANSNSGKAHEAPKWICSNKSIDGAREEANDSLAGPLLSIINHTLTRR